MIKDFQLADVRNVIIDVTLRHEFHGSRADPQRNGDASHVDVNGALDAAVKEKLDQYQHDYNARNYFFLPAVTAMTANGDLRKNQWRLPPSAIHTISSPSSELFHMHGHP